MTVFEFIQKQIVLKVFLVSNPLKQFMKDIHGFLEWFVKYCVIMISRLKVKILRIRLVRV